MALKYTSTKELSDILRMTVKVPSRDVGGVLTKENIGTGDNSATEFYFAQSFILPNTETIFYGIDEASATDTLILTTDYTLDADEGLVTLTAAGVTKVGTNSMFAKYSYNNQDFADSYLQDVLERAESEVDSTLNTTFTDGTTTNPSYPNNLDVMSSQGLFNRGYFVDKLPLLNIETTLATSITDSDTSLTVATGDGTKFPTSGKILIGTEIISYTGVSTDTLTGLIRGEDSSTAAAHTSGDTIVTTIVEVSETLEGTTPTFTPLKYAQDFYADEEGNVFIHEDTVLDNIPQDIPNRIKVRYLYGYDTVPKEIKRLTLLFAKRNLIQDNLGKANIEGRNEFKPEMFNVDINEINRIVNAWRINAMKNT